jgi:hypothetical protein
MKQVSSSTVAKVWLLLTTMGATGCLGHALLQMLPACHEEKEAAIARASKEFSCPPEKIDVLWRTDVSEDLFDLAACGHRARYTCFSDKDANRRIHCVREPDPATWLPDPLTISSLPQPQETTRNAHCQPGESRRICRDQHDYEKNLDCLLPTAPVTLPQGRETTKPVPNAEGGGTLR